ncbi:hypothetical protein ABIA06_003280 [Bradyrhizobium yuanmingense]
MERVLEHHWDYVVKLAGGMTELKASVSHHDDGKHINVGLYCREATALDHAIQAITNVASGQNAEVMRIDAMHARFTFQGTRAEQDKLSRAAIEAARSAMSAFGYQEGLRHGPSYD